MKMTMTIAASLFALLAAVPAWASCDDELAALDKTVQSQATRAVATSGGGEGVAAKRNSEAIASRDNQEPVKIGQSGPAGGSKETQATTQAAKAGGSGDRVMQAKATINDARVAKGKGDEAGCMAAVTKAKSQLND
jgi:hypothetical protein